MTGCGKCDHGFVEVDGAYARCVCVTGDDSGTDTTGGRGHPTGGRGRDSATQDDAKRAARAMGTEPARLHRGATPAQQMTVASLDLPTLSERRRTTLRRVAAHEDGITCDALEARYGGSHQSVSATLNWLERHDLVARDRDDMRRTRSGRTANPYHVTATGAAVLRDPSPST